MRLLHHLEPLVPEFDGFIIDLWGVLHDGTHPYPDAIATLESLRDQNKQIILLSNAPRKALKAAAVLDEIGFDRALYDHVLTSGQVTYGWVGAENPWGNRYYYIGPPKDEDILDGLPVQRVSRVEQADFAIVTGFNDFGDGMDTKLPELSACLSQNLPLICANPDRKVVKLDGRTMLCAGLLAEWYEQRGGTVEYFGKPYPKAYEQCFATFKGLEKQRIAAIGDSLHTDIAGAQRAGIYGILIAGGILAAELGITEYGALPDTDALAPLCQREGATPDAVLPVFRW